MELNQDNKNRALDITYILKNKKNSIQFQFSVFIILLSVFLVGTIGYFTLKEEKSILIRGRVHLGLTMVNNLAFGSKDGILLEDELSIFSVIDGILNNDLNKDIIYIYVADAKGKIIAHNNSALMGTTFKDSLTLYTLYLNYPAMHKVKFEGRDILDFSSPIFVEAKKKKIGIARIGIAQDSINRVVKQAVKKILILFISILVIGLTASIIWVRFITKPVAELAKGAKIIGKGNLNYRFKLKSKNEVGELSVILNKMTKDLSDAQSELISKHQLEHEIELARNIQDTLLPDKIPPFKRFDISAFYKSAKEVGGDYYDFVDIDSSHLGLIIADVSGKSIPGAFVMGITRAIVQSIAKNDTSPKNVLCKANSILHTNIKKGMFVTMLYVVINHKTLETKIASAGHDPLFYFEKNSSSVKMLNPSGIALGVRKDEKFCNKMVEEKLVLNNGDFLALTTDGITEAMNSKGEEFGEDRLVSILKDNVENRTGEVKNMLLKEISHFTGGIEQSDDITMVLLKVENSNKI